MKAHSYREDEIPPLCLGGVVGKERTLCLSVEERMEKEWGGIVNMYFTSLSEAFDVLCSLKPTWCHEISADKQASDHIALIIEEEPDKKKKDKTLQRKQNETPNLATLQVREQ